MVYDESEGVFFFLRNITVVVYIIKDCKSINLKSSYFLTLQFMVAGLTGDLGLP